MKQLSDRIKLNNGYEIPCIGYGTWQTPDGDVAVSAVKCAIEAGYRHIDTAAIYGNEKSVGQAIAESDIDRRELFITSKLWNTERGYDKTLRAFEETMTKLGLEYLDLYLIHWPANAKQFENWDALNLDTWRAMIKLYQEGRIKTIGVSNFLPHHLKSLMETDVVPAVNQIEYHPGYLQDEAVTFCKENGILIEAWSPIGAGALLEDATLVKLAEKYQRSVAQICIRWCLQNGTVPLPKSVTPSRIYENTKVFDFELSAEDVAIINRLPACGGSSHPDRVDF
ncbi:MAG: aldo/keto reductase [Ruminococcaceae bacterium]|nr:aldo/keto reductase [Oscillospiraceae bacterium]